MRLLFHNNYKKKSGNYFAMVAVGYAGLVICSAITSPGLCMKWCKRNSSNSSAANGACLDSD